MASIIVVKYRTVVPASKFYFVPGEPTASYYHFDFAMVAGLVSECHEQYVEEDFMDSESCLSGVFKVICKGVLQAPFARWKSSNLDNSLVSLLTFTDLFHYM